MNKYKKHNELTKILWNVTFGKYVICLLVMKKLRVHTFLLYVVEKSHYEFPQYLEVLNPQFNGLVRP